MKVGDLVTIKNLFTAHGVYELPEEKIAMIVEGPNEVGKIRVLLSDGQKMWIHSAETNLLKKERRYLKE